VVDVGPVAGGLLDQVEGPLDHGEVAQAEEVHLEQAQVGHAVHLVLGDDGRVLGRAPGLGLPLHGQVLGEGLAGDHHRGGVDAVLAAEALEALGHVDHLVGVGIALVQRAQLPRHLVAVLVAGLGLEARGQRRVPSHHQGRHGLGDAVAHQVRVAQHPGRVAHRGPGLDGGEGDDLGHVVGPVTLGRVADHLAPGALVEVHVDVGHLLAPGVEEALEQEVVLDGVEVDDAQAVGHAAPGRRPPPGAGADARFPGVADEVPHHQEVGRKAHADDDAQLVLEPLGHGRGQGVAVAPVRPLQGELAQVVVLRCHPLGEDEPGQLGLSELDLDPGPLGDGQGVVAGLGELTEQVAHLRRRLQVVLVALEAEPLGVVDGGTRLHAQEGVVGHGLVGTGVVAVVGGQQRRTQPAGELDQLGVGAALALDAVVLQLDEEVVGPEDVAQAAGQTGRLGRVVAEQGLADDAAEAPGGGDDALGVALEQLPVDPGLVEVALEVGGRRELHQVLVTGGALGQQGQVVVELAAPVALPPGVVHAAPAQGPLEAALGGHVGLEAHQGHDALRPGGAVEVEDPVHVAVVGDADRGLAVGGRGGDDLIDARGAVEHRELGVHVEVGKRVPHVTSYGWLGCG
jgi:hypothetical protein